MVIRDELINLHCKYLTQIPNKTRVKKELLRKLIHITIAFSPLLASVVGSYEVAALLFLCSLFYFITELFRISGVNIPVITKITNLARRSRDASNKITLGPLTLAIGSMICFLFLPLQYATIGILSLAFGDGLASLVGVIFGATKTFFGKSLEGSIACFIGVFASSYAITQNMQKSILLAFLITVIEALPLKDFDNIIIPLTAGLFILFLDFVSITTKLLLFI